MHDLSDGQIAMSRIEEVGSGNLCIYGCERELQQMVDYIPMSFDFKECRADSKACRLRSQNRGYWMYVQS
jgi:hypothetical protein